MKKKCGICKKNKPFSDYHNHTCSKDRKAYYCKLCASQAKKEWIKKNPDKYKAQLERRKNNPWYSNKANMAKKIQKQRDNRKNLTDNYIIQLILSPGTPGEDLTKKDITPEMIELHRIGVKLKRELGLTKKIEE